MRFIWGIRVSACSIESGISACRGDAWAFKIEIRCIRYGGLAFGGPVWPLLGKLAALVRLIDILPFHQVCLSQYPSISSFPEQQVTVCSGVFSFISNLPLHHIYSSHPPQRYLTGSTTALR
jgi:hypothetical protein